MQKLTTLLAFLTFSAGLWAETQSVSYLYPELNDSRDPFSGIKEWKTGTVDATVVTNATTTLSGWCVVLGEDVQTGGLVCNGAVHLILADGAKLTAAGGDNQAGIQVSGKDNSLTIYGQTKQTGQLIAIGESGGAGIGGGNGQKGSNITINGGIITATGGEGGGAGIGGGGNQATGSDITINGGTITAIGGGDGSGIGGGDNGQGQNIYVSKKLIVNAGDSEDSTEEIENNGDDIEGSLTGKRYVIISLTSDPTPVIVSYIDENGIEQTTSAYKIKNATRTLNAGWYVVLDEEVETGTLICNGAVNLILADGASLTATSDHDNPAPGIQVSGDGNSLTIYGQVNQTGELIANGENASAGIGGGNEQSGSHITINGGIVTANAGDSGAGIGGGLRANGHDITINGGNVVANGFAGIGSGEYSETSSYNIFVAANLVVKAGDDEDSATEIALDHLVTADHASKLAGKSYVTIESPAFVSAAYIDANGVEKTALAIEITNATTMLKAGWYVVMGSNVTTGRLICNGEVHLILADGAKLTASGEISQNAIQVSGDGNSLTIYGQTNQTGQLFANGGYETAGIGGRYSHITINGGKITATGGKKISVEGNSGVGIGGDGNSSSNIYVATNLIVKADHTANPTDIIATARKSTTDIASYLAGKQYVIIEPNMLPKAKADAIDAINGAIEDADNDNVKDIATDAVTAINAVETIADVTLIQDFALKAIASARAAYEDGQDKLVGRTETSGPAVEVKKGEKTIIIYAPDKVTFKQVKSEL